MDRNCDSDPVTDKAWASLSARRAWIEIQWVWMPLALPVVALRKESVDRNITIWCRHNNLPPSLSARRAWIEICTSCLPLVNMRVALRKESVDRNAVVDASLATVLASLSARRAWIEMLSPGKGHPKWCRRSPQGERG